MKYIVFVVFFFIYHVEAYGVFPDYKFHTLSPKGGLNYDGVFRIKQDRFGFIWTLLPDELYRFDGYNYKRFSDQIRNSNIKFLSNASIQLEEDTLGNLYVESLNGIMKYDRHNEQFSEYKLGRVYNMRVDAYNKLWLVNSFGLNQFDLKTGKLQLFLKHSILNTGARILLRNDGKNFYAILENGSVLQYNYSKHVFRKIYQITPSLNFTDIRIDNNTLWLLTINEGLWKINLKQNKIVKKYTFLCDTTNPIKVRLLLIDKQKKIWIATQQGLFVFNPLNEEYLRFQHIENDEFSIPNNSIWNLDLDREGNLWVSTFQGGICYLNFNEMSFFKTISVQSTSYTRNTISCFIESGNNLWIGTEGSGLICYDKITRRTVNFKHTISENSLQMDYIKTMCFDHRNKNIWIGMSGGLDCYNIVRNRFSHISTSVGQSSLNQINRIESESDTGIWIGFKDATTRIARLDFKNVTPRFLELGSGKYGFFYGNSIADFCRDDNDLLWIASPERLHQLNLKTMKLSPVLIKKELGFHNENLSIQTLYLDKFRRFIWIGTKGYGLLKYDIKSGNLNRYDEIIALNVHSIVSITGDQNSDIWLGTDNGLFKFNTGESRFYRFVKKDGIQGNVFYPRSCFNSITGEIFFGGTEGFNVFVPDDVKQSNCKVKIMFSEFYVDNTPVSPGTTNSPLFSSLTSTRDIILDFNHRNFGFDFSTTNFLIPEKTRFKYRLKGYDNDWIEVDANRRYVSYSKVPPGDYVFEVLATNSDGIWLTKPQTIQIHVLAAIWLRWWSLLTYAIVFVLIIYFLLRYYLKQKKMKMDLQLKAMEITNKEAVHQSQIQFFTYISHDFKTPLSLILGTIERIKENMLPLQARYLQTLENNANRLLNLVTELMDFRMVEENAMQLKVAEGNIIDFIKVLSDDFMEAAKSRNLNYQIIFDSIDENQWFDRQILEKVIMNLINNSFKYTKSGTISIQVKSDKSIFETPFPSVYAVGEIMTSSYVRIVIKDTGVGISTESISKVFNRFYMVEDPMRERHLGSGIGLALVKSLVLLHHGHIEISSERDSGTCIVVSIPTERQAYSEEEIIDESGKEYFSISPKNYIMESKSDIDQIDVLEDATKFFLRERKQILLVEDNDELRTLLADALSDSFDVCESIDGVEATDLLQRKDIDLIISDIMMPRKDGYTLCREIKECLDTSHIPFIMITAKSGLDNQLLGLDSGADAYIEKPVNIRLLKMYIFNIFSQQNRIKEFYARHHFSDNPEMKINQKENDFIRKLMDVIDRKLDQPELDIAYLTQEMMMSRTKLYAKLKALTGKSIVEFVRYYKMRKAARLLIEENLPLKEVMDAVGIDTPSYFTRVFKQEFGETPTSFIANAKKRQNGDLRN